MQTVILAFVLFLSQEPGTEETNATEFSLKTGSFLAGLGTQTDGGATDFCNNFRPDPPSVGAFEVYNGLNCDLDSPPLDAFDIIVTP